MPEQSFQPAAPSATGYLAVDPARDPVGALHPRLAGDCHLLGRLERASVLLHRNARVAWLILVPDTDARGWHELDDAEHDRISRQVRDLSITAGEFFVADKMNVAAIGNEVPQMHVHVVARHENDACWTKPVWGHLPPGDDYTASRIDTITAALADTLNLKALERGDTNA